MTELSPAAQAIMVAATNGNINVVNDPVYKQCIAAALRAIADQVVPEDDPKSFVPGSPRSFALQRRATRRQLLAIATELEGFND